MAQKREGSPLLNDDNTKRPVHKQDQTHGSGGEQTHGSTDDNLNKESDILKLLLEGQKKMSQDLRASLDKQEVHSTDIERTKANVMGMGYKLGDVFTSQHDILDALDFNSHELQDLREKVKMTSNLCKQNEKKQNEFTVAMNKVNERLDRLERAQLEMSTEIRAKGIVISGLKEQQNEDPHLVSYNFLTNIEPTLKFDDLDICYRLGTSQTESKNSKNMMVVFMGLGKKQQIMKKKNNLKDNPSYKSTYLNDDLPQETREIRENLRDISRYAGEKGYKSKVSGNRLVVDGKIYQPHELDFLPTDILPDKVKTRRRGDGIAFQGPTSILSNLYPCEINIQGIVFNCAEQAYAYKKGLWCNRENLAHKVMLLSNPKEIKKAGDNMPVDRTWEKEKVSVMEEIVHNKFYQNKALAKKLCETGNYPLYEGTTNTFWGCGFRINSKLWLNGNPPGQNRLGKMLMEVRSKLMDRREYKSTLIPSSTIVSGDLPDVPNVRENPCSDKEEPAPSYSVAPSVSESVEQLEKSMVKETAAQSQAPAPTPTGQPTEHSDEYGLIPPNVITSTPNTDNVTMKETSPGKTKQDEMDLENQDTILGTQDTNLSINNESISSSDMSSNYKDISTDGIFDLKKIQSWSLPSIQRRTAELHRKVNLAKRRTSQFVTGRVNKPGHAHLLSMPSSSEDHSRKSPQPRFRDRSFTNSSLKKGPLDDMGFSTDSDFVKSIASHENINDRRRSKPKK